MSIDIDYNELINKLPWDATSITTTNSTNINSHKPPGMPSLPYLKGIVAALSAEDQEEFIAYTRSLQGPTPPKFKTTEEADAWMEANSESPPR
jgi:hypothetical protein